MLHVILCPRHVPSSYLKFGLLIGRIVEQRCSISDFVLNSDHVVDCTTLHAPASQLLHTGTTQRALMQEGTINLLVISLT